MKHLKGLIMGNLSADKFESVLRGRILLHRFIGVLSEYNHYHGAGGRFAAGGAGGGGTYVPGKGEKEEAAEGVLSKEEQKEIDKIANTITAKSTDDDVDKALEDCMTKVGLGVNEYVYAKDGMKGLTTTSQGPDGARLTMALNMAHGQKPRANMSPAMAKVAKDPRVKTPTKNQVKAVATTEALNQAVLRKQHGTHVTVYRGVKGDYSKNIKATKATDVDINVRSLGSWTTNQSIAKGFDGKGETLLKAKIPVSRIAFSHNVSSSMKRYGEGEHVLYSSKGSLSTTVVH